MKHISIITMFVTIVLMSCGNSQKHDGYTLKGEIIGLAEGKIVLNYYDNKLNKLVVVDSAQIKHGQFQMTGKLESPFEINAQILPANANFRFWIENSSITIEADIKDVKTSTFGYKSLEAKISGSSIQDEFDQYYALLLPIRKRMEPLETAFDEANLKLMQAMKAQKPEKEIKALEKAAYAAKSKVDAFYPETNKVTQQYTKEHPTTWVTASQFAGSISEANVEERKQQFNTFSDAIKHSKLGKAYQANIERVKRTATGNVAASFSAQDINGNSLSLDDFKGKYVLLDFWASWCKPCRAGNPHLIKLYNKYNKVGFDIIGIADDNSNVAAWKKAVEVDQIGIWHHILSGKGDNDIADYYAVRTLPTKILVDPNGNMIGRYGSEEEALDQQLEKIFGE